MSKVTALYLGAEVEDKLWFPVRKMVWHGEKYRTGCVGGVQGLIEAAPLWRHYFQPSNFGLIKTTRDIHCDYACRMPLDRPQEMPWYLPSLGLPSDLLNPIAFVARNGGYRETDSLDVFPEVAADPDGCYRFYFLLRKLYLVEEAAVDAVVRGDKIEAQDSWAIHQPTGNRIGILPGYIKAVVTAHSSQVEMKVHQVNHEEIPQSRLLCSLTCQGFVPFTTAEYLPLGDLN